MHQPYAQHSAGAGQPRVRKRRFVISIEHLRKAAAGDRPAQQVLAGAGVLVREEPAVDQQPGMSSTMRNSRARADPSRFGYGTHGPASTSVIHRSLGRAASYRP
jgi:hypothetical protein